MRGARHAERGAALLSFALFLALIVLAIIVGMSSSFARKAAGTLEARQAAYVAEVAKRAHDYYAANIRDIDSNSNWTTIDDAAVRFASLDQVTKPDGQLAEGRWGVQVLISDRLQSAANATTPTEQVYFRRILVYIGVGTDDTYPPDVSNFKTQGLFVSCPAGANCDPRAFAIVDGEEMQRSAIQLTKARLSGLALKAQGYFKARLLQDPERNVSVNYFRPLSPSCSALPYEVPCTAPDYTALGDAGMQSQLSLTTDEYVDGWGQPILVNNAQAAPNSIISPYSMLFQATDPFGNVHRVFAAQPQ